MRQCLVILLVAVLLTSCAPAGNDIRKTVAESDVGGKAIATAYNEGESFFQGSSVFLVCAGQTLYVVTVISTSWGNVEATSKEKIPRVQCLTANPTS